MQPMRVSLRERLTAFRIEVEDVLSMLEEADAAFEDDDAVEGVDLLREAISGLRRALYAVEASANDER